MGKFFREVIALSIPEIKVVGGSANAHIRSLQLRKDMLDYFKWEKDTFLDVDTSRVYFLKYTDKHNNGFNYGDWENHNPKDSICLSCEYYVTGGRENMYYRGIMVTFKKGKMFIVNNPYYLFFYRRVKSNIIFQVPMI